MPLSQAASRSTLLVLLAVFVASVAVSAQIERPAGRSLKAATDAIFDFYSQNFPLQNVLVCDDCSGELLNAYYNGYSQDGFQVWIGSSGTITNNGNGGYDNWQFRTCPGAEATRSGNQGHTVTFPECACPTYEGVIC